MFRSILYIGNLKQQKLNYIWFKILFQYFSHEYYVLHKSTWKAPDFLFAEQEIPVKIDGNELKEKYHLNPKEQNVQLSCPVTC